MSWRTAVPGEQKVPGSATRPGNDGSSCNSDTRSNLLDMCDLTYPITPIGGIRSARDRVPESRPRRRIAPKRADQIMTVCIAARSEGWLVLAADRMLSTGDLSFEPQRPKIIPITSSIYIMTAGDAAFQSLVLTPVFTRANRLVRDNPLQWLSVFDIARSYVNEWNLARERMAEDAILAPLGLNNESFIDKQRDLAPNIAADLTAQLQRFHVPECSVIVAGRDEVGVHIYRIVDNEVSNHQSIGFTAQ